MARRLDFRIFVLFCTLIAGMGQGVVAPRLPELLKNSNGLALSSGLSATLMYLGVYLSTFKCGDWADRGRIHWLLAPGLFAYAVTLFLLGSVDSLGAVFLLRFVEGLAMSAVFVAADYVLGKLSPDHERGTWLSFYGVALSVGLILGPVLSLGSEKIAIWIGISSAVVRSPRVPLTIVGAIACIFAALSVRYRIPAERTSLSGKPAMNRAALLSGGIYGFMESGLVAVLPVVLLTELHLTPEYFLILIILTAAVSSVAWGIAADRFGPKRVVPLLLGLLSIGSISFFTLGSHLTLMQLACSSASLFGIVAGGLYPVGFSWLLESLPKTHYGYGSGGFARAYGLGSLAGPLACGLLAQKWGASGLWLSLATAGSVGWLGVWKQTRER